MAEHAVQHDADAVLLCLGTQGLELFVGAQQGVYVEVVGGVVAVVGVRLKDGVQVEEIHAHLVQVGQLELDALQVAAEVVLIQVAAHFIGLPEGFGVFVGLIDAVREGHGLVLHPFAEAVREDLVEHFALDGLRRLEGGIVNRDLPFLTVLPADHAAVVRPAHDAAKVGVEVKIVEVEAGVVEGDFDREVVLFGGLAVEVHPVVYRHVESALFLKDEVRVHIAEFFGDAEGESDALPGPHGTEGLLEIGIVAVEQARQVGSFLSRKKLRSRCTVRSFWYHEVKTLRQCFALLPTSPDEGRLWHFVELLLFARGTPIRGAGERKRDGEVDR